MLLEGAAINLASGRQQRRSTRNADQFGQGGAQLAGMQPGSLGNRVGGLIVAGQAGDDDRQQQCPGIAFGARFVRIGQVLQRREQPALLIGRHRGCSFASVST
jgi:hypothetical protein